MLIPQAPTFYSQGQSHGLPAQVAANATANSNVINTNGLTKGSAGLVSDHAGTLQVQRYVDANGQVALGALITDNTSPYSVAWSDGLPCGSIVVSFVNTAGAVANLSNIAINLSA
jgi:hypothetical protein